MSVGLIAYLLGAATIGRSAVTSGETVTAYATGSALHVDALQVGATGPRIADVEGAFSAANADSNGFAATSRVNENNVAVQPGADATPVPYVGKNASARGEALGVGLGDNVPDLARSILDETLSGAVAPPDHVESHDDGPIPANPLIYASLLHSDALAQWTTSTCLTTAQSPISYGRGYAANVELLSASQANNPDGSLVAPVVATNNLDPNRNALTTWSEVYAIPNGTPGHYGLVSEVHQTYAPIDIVQDPTTGGTIEIEVLGEWYTRTVADGVHKATITTGVTDPKTGLPMDPSDTVVRLTIAGSTPIDISLGQITGATGLEIPLSPLADIMIGEDVRAISAPDAQPDPTSAPTLAADGTHASGAVDVVRAQVLNGAAGAGTHLADLRIGHFESDLAVPAGGFTCPAAATTTSTTSASTTSSTAGPTTSTTAGPTTTTTAAPTTTTTAGPTTTTSTTVKPTTTTFASPSSTTAPPTTSTTLGTRAEAATAVRAQPRTVG